MNKILLLFLCGILTWGAITAQPLQDEVMKGRGPFTRADTLRGMLLPERACYDVRHYDLSIRIDPVTRSISGANVIRYDAVLDFSTLQIDLFETLTIDSILADSVSVPWKRTGKAVFVTLPKPKQKGSGGVLVVYYHGKPNEAANPPWDGGFVWRVDGGGKPWVGVACEGHGASSWWPLKDHGSDEPDSMRIVLSVPRGLMGVSNGELRSVVNKEEGYTDYEWYVSYPINSYNVTVNLADYAHLQDVYVTDSSRLKLDYYVLRANTDKAREHFAQVKPMLQCFEQYLGPYPFQRDGFALVETSYWGMEHQGAVAYGNNYRNLKWGWDFIIVHESGHEWFGNSLTAIDHGDMWLHEAFTTYVEALYMECRYGKEKAQAYLLEQRDKIKNVDAIQGPYGVKFNDWKNADMYYKGTWMLHTMRSVINDDKIWFSTLKKLLLKYRVSIVNSEEVIAFFNQETGKDLRPIFYAYLRYIQPPKFEYTLVLPKRKSKFAVLSYRWVTGQQGFNMPVDIVADGVKQRIFPTAQLQTVKLPASAVTNFSVDTDRYYVSLGQILPPQKK